MAEIKKDISDESKSKHRFDKQYQLLAGETIEPVDFSRLFNIFIEFDSLKQAFNYLSDYYGRGEKFENKLEIDIEKMQVFIETFGYQVDTTRIFRFPSGWLMIESQLPRVKCYEFVAGYPSIDWSENQRSKRVTIEMVLVENEDGKIIMLSEPGAWLVYIGQAFLDQATIIYYGTKIFQSHPIGAMANRESDQLAGVIFLHEQYHYWFDKSGKADELRSEINASEYALNALDFLAKKGFIIQTQNVEEIKGFLVKSLNTYIKKQSRLKWLWARISSMVNHGRK